MSISASKVACSFSPSPPRTLISTVAVTETAIWSAHRTDLGLTGLERLLEGKKNEWVRETRGLVDLDRAERRGEVCGDEETLVLMLGSLDGVESGVVTIFRGIDDAWMLILVTGEDGPVKMYLDNRVLVRGRNWQVAKMFDFISCCFPSYLSRILAFSER